MKRRITILTAALALLVFLVIPTGMKGQTRGSESFTFSELGYGNADDVTTVVGDNVTLTFAQGTHASNAPKYYNTGSGVRMYTGNTLEVALNDQTGETTITAIAFTFSGTYSGSLQNWSGSETSVSFTNTASNQARIQVIAITFSDGGSTTTYTVTYNANVAGTAPIVDTYVEGADVTLRPANTFTNNGYDFSEWNTDANGDGDPYDAGDVIEGIDSDIELYAIWTESTPSDDHWVLTNLADLTADDVFVIVGNNGSNYAMSNDGGTTNPPAAVAITVADNVITSAVAANIQWTISGNATNGYIFYPNGSTETWLYCTGTNNGVRVGTNNANTFKVESSSGYLVHQGTSRYVGVYTPSEATVAKDWRCYTSINSNIQDQTFAFYKKVTGDVLPPSISAENVSIAYNAVSGSIAYTINNSVNGGTVSAAVTDGDWLTLGQGTTSPISFTCSANTAATERTATVTLTYTYNRATVSANVTVTQAGDPNVTPTIAEVRAQGTGSAVTKGVVTSITGSSNKTAYIQDATAAIVVYGNFTAAVGDEIRVSGTLQDYNGLLEITSPQVTVISSNNTVNPELMTVAQAVASTNQGWYIRIEGATVNTISGQNVTIAQDGSTIVVRFGNANDITFEANDIISLDGNIGYYNVNQIANPQNVEVQQNTQPSITFDPATINIDAGQNVLQIPFTYQNIEVTNYQSFAIQFYDADGGETEMPTQWLIVQVTGTNDEGYQVTGYATANDGDARSAYFKVYSGSVYSNLFTINQAEYVAPTYAILPFEFDEGKAAIESTDGLYQEGLGSDYNNSPKLKFDGDGDWLRLQFSEEPGKLTFDIKGNGSGSTPWAGTFILQTSEDGETYTDHATYTELPSSKETYTITDLGSDVRYIKWIYAEKTVGNVALGNIKLLQPATLVAYDLTIEPFENLEIFTFVGGDETEAALEGAGTIQVTEGDEVMLSVSAEEGFVMQSLMVDGVEHVNDITADLTYTFNMPDHNVTISATAVADVPFEPVTYTLATTIESGKSYIIVGFNDEGQAYAMGEQRSNNRKGVAITADGATATVNTADVHEVVITALDVTGFYSIYDDGYLYAAGSGNNYLRTLDTLNVNGQWQISIDSVCSIVATNSENRNVMRFNYTQSNPLFSCYASAETQKPVYLYVKDEAVTTVTQTVALSSGWNYFSPNVEITLDDLKAALVEALPGTAMMIKSKTGNCRYTGSTWRAAGLTSLDVSQMYKISVTADCEIQLTGMPIDPIDYPITIVANGNTYIGYPLRTSMSVANAFAGFGAVSGDMVKSKTGNSRYTGTTWRAAGLTNLEPGQGYIYVSKSTEDRTFTFPADNAK